MSTNRKCFSLVIKHIGLISEQGKTTTHSFSDPHNCTMYLHINNNTYHRPTNIFNHETHIVIVIIKRKTIHKSFSPTRKNNSQEFLSYSYYYDYMTISDLTLMSSVDSNLKQQFSDYPLFYIKDMSVSRLDNMHVMDCSI